MVSFQCHNCGDVVKKPKLDQHRSRCQDGFDCIDCSTTFNTPAEYKSHTSCISEAEKYQKSLYKGPKNDNNRNYKQNGSPRGQNQNYNNGYQNHRGGYGGRPSWNQPRNHATGANDTLLGTPPRMSPVTRPEEPEKSSDAATTVVVEPVPVQVEEKAKESEKKKDKVKKEKKRKVEDECSRELGGPPKKKVKVDGDITETVSIPLLPSSTKKEGRKEKKVKERKVAVETEKQERKEKAEKARGADGEMMVETVETDTVKKKREKKEKGEQREKKEKSGKDELANVKNGDEKRKEKGDKKEKRERKKQKLEKMITV